MPAGRIALAFTICLTLLRSVSLAAVPQSLGDAAIDQSAPGAWTIAAGGAALSVVLDPAQGYQVTALRSPAGTNWVRVIGADTVATADGVQHLLGSSVDGFGLTSLSTDNNGQRLQLDAAFTLTPQNLLVTRHVKVVPGSPSFEVWTTFQALGDPVPLSNLNAFRAVVAPGTLHWLTGHAPAAGDTTLDSTFARRQQLLTAGQSVTFGSTARSSEQTVPWLAIDGAGDEFYGGLMWSGAWSLTATQTDAGLSIDWGLGDMTTAVGSTAIDGPHAIIGVARGSLAEASAALRSYVIDGLRSGRPFTPLVTYNTWFAYGTRVDESTVRREMARAASIGVELFVIDAGWYSGADTHDSSDFESLSEWSESAGRLRAQPWDEVRLVGGTGAYRPIDPRRRRPGRIGARHRERQLSVAQHRHGVPGRRGRPEMGPRSTDRAARFGAAGLSEMGQQPVAELRPGGARPRRERRQLRTRQCALSGARHAAPEIPEARHRELFLRRQPDGLRHAARHRRRVDGRSHGALGARPPQHRRPEPRVPAGVAAVVRDELLPGAAAECPGSVVVSP